MVKAFYRGFNGVHERNMRVGPTLGAVLCRGSYVQKLVWRRFVPFHVETDDDNDNDDIETYPPFQGQAGFFVSHIEMSWNAQTFYFPVGPYVCTHLIINWWKAHTVARNYNECPPPEYRSYAYLSLGIYISTHKLIGYFHRYSNPGVGHIQDHSCSHTSGHAQGHIQGHSQCHTKIQTQSYTQGCTQGNPKVTTKVTSNITPRSQLNAISN